MMSNNDAAQAIRDMDAPQKGQVKQALLGMILKVLAALALLGVVGVFLTMQDAESERSTYVTEGTVSRAVVLGTAIDDYTLVNKKGDTARASKNFVRIAHNPDSTIRYSDLGKSVMETDLPAPTGKDYTGSIDMDDAAFAGIKTGDVLTVVTTPYAKGSPWLLAKVRDYSPNGYFRWMGIFGALAIALWFVGRAVSRR